MRSGGASIDRGGAGCGGAGRHSLSGAGCSDDRASGRSSAGSLRCPSGDRSQAAVRCRTPAGGESRDVPGAGLPGRGADRLRRGACRRRSGGGGGGVASGASRGGHRYGDRRDAARRQCQGVEPDKHDHGGRARRADRQRLGHRSCPRLSEARRRGTGRAGRRRGVVPLSRARRCGSVVAVRGDAGQLRLPACGDAGARAGGGRAVHGVDHRAPPGDAWAHRRVRRVRRRAGGRLCDRRGGARPRAARRRAALHRRSCLRRRQPRRAGGARAALERDGAASQPLGLCRTGLAEPGPDGADRGRDRCVAVVAGGSADCPTGAGDAGRPAHRRLIGAVLAAAVAGYPRVARRACPRRAGSCSRRLVWWVRKCCRGRRRGCRVCRPDRKRCISSRGGCRSGTDRSP